MKVIILCPYPSQKAPSQRFRFEQYLDLLEGDFAQYPFWTEKEWPRIYERGRMFYKVFSTMRGFLRRFLLLFTIGKYDKVFIHREATPIGPPWMEWVIRKIWRKPIIFDFDDAIWLPNSSKANEKTAGKLKFHGKTAKICSWATTCSVGNQFLADYAGQFCDDVRIIPTTIDTVHHHNPDLFERINGKWRRIMSPSGGGGEARAGGGHLEAQRSAQKTPKIHSGPKSSENENPVTIGWTGSHSTLKQLTPLFPVLEEIHQKHPFRFLLIADIPPETMPDFVEFRKWRKESEIEDLLEIDIGVMPLYDTDWERGKCGFKALQYMALGIPAVISAVGVNVEIGNNDSVILAESNNTDEKVVWADSILHLLHDDSERSKQGRAGRLRVQEKYSVLATSKEYEMLLV